MNDFLGIADLDRGVLERLVESASRFRHDRSFRSGALAGSRIGLFFEKPSTRTRVSSEVAAVDLGAHPVVLGQDEVGIGSREAVRDVARVLDRYLDLVAMRVFDHRTLVEMAEHADAPVVNLLSDIEHPCQAVADLQTIAEHRQVAESVVAYVGDGNNVCHSLMLGGGEARGPDAGGEPTRVRAAGRDGGRGRGPDHGHAGPRGGGGGRCGLHGCVDIDGPRGRGG